jgi:hypothetical protein
MALLSEVYMALTVRVIVLFWTNYIPYLGNVMLPNLFPPQIIVTESLMVFLAVFMLQSKYKK